MYGFYLRSDYLVTQIFLEPSESVWCMWYVSLQPSPGVLSCPVAVGSQHQVYLLFWSLQYHLRSSCREKLFFKLVCFVSEGEICSFS
ncbi:unnamed protein product [Brassica oleracea var. botrytis]